MNQAFRGLSLRLLRGARALRVALAVVGVVAMVNTARATTSDGTLITNVATATFGSVGSLTAPWANAWYEISYAATQTVLVATPNVQLQKTSQPSIECSGGTITFCIWAVNTSSLTSAFNVYLQDKYPPLVSYVVGQTMWPGLTAGSAIWNNWCTTTPTLTRNPGEPPAGLDAVNGAYYLRWQITMLGPGKSALICYRAMLD